MLGHAITNKLLSKLPNFKLGYQILEQLSFRKLKQISLKILFKNATNTIKNKVRIFKSNFAKFIKCGKFVKIIKLNIVKKFV